MIKHTFILISLLLCLTGCFDYDARPESSAVGNILGCQVHETGHLCAVHYIPVAETQPIPKTKQYECSISDVSQVYDGDTISEVIILVAAVNLETAAELGEVFPDIALKRGGVYVQNEVRIAGIDTPEMRPLTKKSDGTRRSDASRVNKKKAAIAAIAARAAVRRLLEANSLRFTLTDMEHDKFGRMLGKVFVNGVDVKEYLIANRLALWYDGGMREELDWDKLDQGLMW